MLLLRLLLLLLGVVVMVVNIARSVVVVVAAAAQGSWGILQRLSPHDAVVAAAVVGDVMLGTTPPIKKGDDMTCILLRVEVMVVRRLEIIVTGEKAVAIPIPSDKTNNKNTTDENDGTTPTNLVGAGMLCCSILLLLAVGGGGGDAWFIVLIILRMKIPFDFGREAGRGRGKYPMLCGGRWSVVHIEYRISIGHRPIPYPFPGGFLDLLGSLVVSFDSIDPRF
jgi:hypothetical protein